MAVGSDVGKGSGSGVGTGVNVTVVVVTSFTGGKFDGCGVGVS